MITQEFKEKYAALYWGQKVAMIQGFESLITVDARLMEVSKVCKLRLRSLESITDEEAVEVAKIFGLWDGEALDSDISIQEIINDLFDEKCIMPADYVSGFIIGHSVDYLRSCGFALPYLGVSVEEMVKEGFVELIKN